MYIINFFFEYGDGGFLWGEDDQTKNKFGIPIDKDLLPLSKEVKCNLLNLEREYQSSINWDSPIEPSPWSDEQWNDFKKRARQAYDDLVKELGDEYKVIYSV